MNAYAREKDRGYECHECHCKALGHMATRALGMMENQVVVPAVFPESHVRI